MPHTDVTDSATPQAVADDELPNDIPTATHDDASTGLGVMPRGIAVALLCLVAYATTYGQHLSDALAGSRVAYLVVLPVLALVIATGYRTTSHGVGDGESDWIVAALIGILGLAAIYLLVGRMPTLSAWWRLESLSVVVWAVCCVVILFGMRHALSMWSLWLFLAVFATPVPFLAATAALGGTDTAGVLVAAAIGAVAVFLATRTTTLSRRAFAATLSFLAGVPLALNCAVWFLPTVLVAAGVIPILVVVVARLVPSRRGARSGSRPISAGMPHRSARTLVLLTAGTAVLVVAGIGNHQSAPQRSMPADWLARAGLNPVQSYGFATEFAGPGATLIRYGVPAQTGMPAAAVDVLSTPNEAALDDLSDVVWYPSGRPVSYRSVASSAAIPAGTRDIHSDADAAADAGGQDWYAMTWTQRAGSLFQRVTVIVTQSLSEDQAPPAPQPPDVLDDSVGSWLWMSRQRPQGLDHVDPLVTQRATTLAATISRLPKNPSPRGPADQ